MRILIHDYSGHPPPLMIGRELARRGHDVVCLYAKMNQTPKGPLTPRSSDPTSFQIAAVDTGRPVPKYQYIRRYIQEAAYGRVLVDRVKEIRPDLVICSDTPLSPLNRLRSHCVRTHISFVLWMMDVKGLSISNWLRRTSPVLASTIGRFFIEFEKYIVRRCNHLILISRDYRELVLRWGVPSERVDLFPLWGPLDDIGLCSKETVWGRRHGLTHTQNLIYAGTLGVSHSPEPLVELAKGLAYRADVKLVVATEGINAAYLNRRCAEDRLDNLLVLPYQPYGDLQAMFGAADLLLTILNEDASKHSVPSKVLSYLCAGIPQLAIMPLENHAAQVIRNSGGGIVVPPGDASNVLSTAERLLDDVEMRKRMGRNARAYAEREFNIRRIGERFESVIMKTFANNGSAETRRRTRS